MPLGQNIDQNSSTLAAPENFSVYHERQTRWRCGLHAVNALLKRPAYTPAHFDAIADSLAAEYHTSWYNPHRSAIGMGNYDANVLLTALRRAHKTTAWLSEKDDIEHLLETKPNLCGFLVNVESKHWFRQISRIFFEGGRHWIAIVRYEDQMFLVDSDDNFPSKFASHVELLDYLNKVRSDEGHVMLVESLAEMT